MLRQWRPLRPSSTTSAGPRAEHDRHGAVRHRLHRGDAEMLEALGMAAGVLAVARGVGTARRAGELHELRARHVHEHQRGPCAARAARLRTRGRPSLRRARAASPRRGARARRAARPGPSRCRRGSSDPLPESAARAPAAPRPAHPPGGQHRRVHAEPLADVRARELGVAKEAVVERSAAAARDVPAAAGSAPWPGVRAVRNWTTATPAARLRGGTSLTRPEQPGSSSAERAVTSASIPAPIEPTRLDMHTQPLPRRRIRPLGLQRDLHQGAAAPPRASRGSSAHRRAWTGAGRRGRPSRRRRRQLPGAQVARELAQEVALERAGGERRQREEDEQLGDACQSGRPPPTAARGAPAPAAPTATGALPRSPSAQSRTPKQRAGSAPARTASRATPGRGPTNPVAPQSARPGTANARNAAAITAASTACGRDSPRARKNENQLKPSCCRAVAAARPWSRTTAGSQSSSPSTNSTRSRANSTIAAQKDHPDHRRAVRLDEDLLERVAPVGHCADRRVDRARHHVVGAVGVAGQRVGERDVPNCRDPAPDVEGEQLPCSNTSIAALETKIGQEKRSSAAPPRLKRRRSGTARRARRRRRRRADRGTDHEAPRPRRPPRGPP